jgi:hypothetical protein
MNTLLNGVFQYFNLYFIVGANKIIPTESSEDAKDPEKSEYFNTYLEKGNNNIQIENYESSEESDSSEDSRKNKYFKNILKNDKYFCIILKKIDNFKFLTEEDFLYIKTFEKDEIIDLLKLYNININKYLRLFM